ncbi:hypothetical protein CVV65_05755 [Kyrpidia spormannii]|uniref:Uncharacterized protein n=2 Tax=Kyrpidia spormannii TaxID=2055160 RepID=A0A2K8NCN5_9BACL|nr:hypothetical protein CVV65_05755 [Kyrpidia spormannii]
MQRFYLTQLYKSETKETQWKPGIPPKDLRPPGVVGAGRGIGGLVTAVEVAKRGAKVLVLDQHYLPGGACTTYSPFPQDDAARHEKHPVRRSIGVDGSSLQQREIVRFVFDSSMNKAAGMTNDL